MFKKVKEVVLDALEKYTPHIKNFIGKQLASKIPQEGTVEEGYYLDEGDNFCKYTENSGLEQTTVGDVLKELENNFVTHNHDDRYYTESETDIKLNNKSDITHNHDSRYYTETETDAKLDEKASAVHTHSYLPLAGGTITGNINTSKTNVGYFMTDSTGNSYPGIYDNGTNFWLGTTATAARHHTGSTFISSGYNAAASDGNASIFVSVPNASNDGGTNYPVLHSGNYISYCPPKAHASSETTYGIGNASNYGHIKLSDSYTNSGGAASSGVGASSDALYNAYTALNTTINNISNKLYYNGCAIDIGVKSLTLSTPSTVTTVNCAIDDTSISGVTSYQAEVYTLNSGGTIILKKAGTYILTCRVKCELNTTANYAFSVISYKWDSTKSDWVAYKSLGSFRSDSDGNYMTVTPTSYVAASANDRLLLRISNENTTGTKTMTFDTRIRLIYLAR